MVARTKLKVNSSHHQAVGRVARPLRANAVSPDGVIEGLELAPAEAGLLPYLLAVQFHPERLYGQYREFLMIFSSFVRACNSGRR
jgi:putative glutamine amidotransferase